MHKMYTIEKIGDSFALDVYRDLVLDDSFGNFASMKDALRFAFDHMDLERDCAHVCPFNSF